MSTLPDILPEVATASGFLLVLILLLPFASVLIARMSQPSPLEI